MPRRKARLEISHRAFEELERLYDVKKYGNKLLVSKMIGCNKKSIDGWQFGIAQMQFTCNDCMKLVLMSFTF